MSKQISAISTNLTVPNKNVENHIENALEIQKSCISCLGSVGALIFFAYSALRPEEPECTNSELLGWVQKLRLLVEEKKQVVALKTDSLAQKRKKREKLQIQQMQQMPKIATTQISAWRRHNPFEIVFSPTEVDGLDYRLLNVQVSGMYRPPIVKKPPAIKEKQKCKRAWKANLIFIFEMKTKQFFHQHIELSEVFKVTDEQILYVIAKADTILCKKNVASPYLEKQKYLTLPEGRVRDKAPSLAYFNILNIFRAGAKNKNKEDHAWMSTKTNIDLKKWAVNLSLNAIREIRLPIKARPYPSRKIGGGFHPLNLDDYMIDSGRKLANAVKRFSNHVEFWDSLSPPKAHSRLHVDRTPGMPPLTQP